VKVSVPARDPVRGLAVKAAVFSFLVLSLFVSQSLFARDENLRAEFEKLRKEVQELRAEKATRVPLSAGVSLIDKNMDNRYGPDATTSTRHGHLKIGGLLQIWYYSIQNDNKAWFDVDRWAAAVNEPPPNPAGSNEVVDNDSFRIRRAELRFSADVHENISAMIMLDPARAALSFPTFPSNQGSGISGDGVADYNPGVAPDGTPIGNVHNEAVREGLGDGSRILQDAYINIHGVLPHHDVSIGQMRRRLGEEGSRDSAQLDFTERAMITQLADLRDTGIQVHGTWFDDRLQYWGGAFNGAGTAFQQRQNRADDNDAKDLTATILGRPVWQDERWGSLELGYSILYGNTGEAGGRRPMVNPVDGLNRADTVRVMQYAWAHYAPGGPAKGFWLRGEWGLYRDRFAPLEAGPGLIGDPAPFDIQGWYFAAGYDLRDSAWKDSLPRWLKPTEFVFRYEDMQNLFYADLVGVFPAMNLRRRLDVFKTTVFTGGLNYYIKGHNAKVQLNYNVVCEESDVSKSFRQVREVRNDNLVVNFQVAW
jgi:hypothetical protein